MKKIVYFFLWLFWLILDGIMWLITRLAPRDGKIENAWDNTSVRRLYYCGKIMKFDDEYISLDELKDWIKCNTRK